MEAQKVMKIAKQPGIEIRLVVSIADGCYDYLEITVEQLDLLVGTQHDGFPVNASLIDGNILYVGR